MAAATATSATREILTRLHDVMASRSAAQAKLNQVVQIIGEATRSEVCSIYLLRDGLLELFATRGLDQAAVHVTKLGLGEGLVGTIAEEVGLSQQTTSHHLGVLRKAGLSVGTREGTRHLFAVDTDGLAAVREYLDDFCPSKLSALKAAVEAGEADRG